MKILIIGNGGREHAIGIKLKKENPLYELYFAKGNGGTESIGVNLPINTLNEILLFAQQQNINLTIVGSEALLVEGIVDAFQKNNLNIFGPNKASAMLEGDKAYAKEFMNEFGIRTAKYHSFTKIDQAKIYIKNHSYPLVIKATGLAAGKGVFIVNDFEQASKIIQDLLIHKSMGEAANEIIIEEFLNGFEVSVLSVFNQNKIYPFISAKDHKKIFENEQGPNTGGMGAIAPNPLFTNEIELDFEEYIMLPTLKGLLNRKLIFSGFIFFGLMVVNNKCYLLEYNMRLGDPETQTLLPLLNSDLIEIIDNALHGKEIQLDWKKEYSCCVVLASKGYPDDIEIGKSIEGLNHLQVAYNIAGAKKEGDSFITTGGRVLNLIGTAESLDAARKNTYESINYVHFDGMYFRKDIGKI